MSKVVCTHCEGSGRTFYICENRMIACHDCKGSGEREYRPPEWLEVGTKLRTNRVVRGLSLGEEAKRRGISVVELSDMEHGRREPFDDSADADPLPTVVSS